MGMTFDFDKKIFKLQVIEEFIVKAKKSYDIEYKGHTYRIDPIMKTITHINGNLDDGAMYYGYSYLYEIKTMLTTRLSVIPQVVCY